MQWSTEAPVPRSRFLLRIAAITILGINGAMASNLEVFHADSLAGPMRELKQAFEAKNAGVTLRLTSGVSRELAGRILNGEVCDVFASSSPAVIDEDLMQGRIGGSGREAATWYVVFSANEMVVITARGNPLAIREVSDLARPEVRFVRITGEKDLGTARTIEFVKRAAAREGRPELASKILDRAPVDPATPTNVPGAVAAVREGKASAAVVYLSAAVAAGNDVEIIRFPESVNQSEAIRNAATVPATARNALEATAFVGFLLSAEARDILQRTGQPPVIPALRKGAVPVGIP